MLSTDGQHLRLFRRSAPDRATELGQHGAAGDRPADENTPQYRRAAIVTSSHGASIRRVAAAAACTTVLTGAVWTSHAEAPEAVVQVKPVDCGGDRWNVTVFLPVNVTCRRRPTPEMLRRLRPS
ncbi:hypothetical protein [Mycobacteroides salmoniphilum]|uniref:hypothetical protein n=1 Tax=Mycobacteroides salmoniphilum TaxID=404941 RepID=UPI0012FF80A8|nr:hypothetical protein [Mycobacteroides salmoniphilum]